jgi:hypothetical protein
MESNMQHATTHPSRSINRKVSTFLLLALGMGILLSGCSPKPLFLKPEYNKKTSFTTVAVLPIQDSMMITDNSKVIKDLSKRLASKLMDRDYDVLPTESVVNILKEKGITENEINNIQSQKLCEMLQVDGVLKSTLSKHKSVFMIRHELDMGIQLFNAAGDSIWIHRAKGNELTVLNNVGFIVAGIFGASSAKTTKVTGSGWGTSVEEEGVSTGTAIGIGVGVGLVVGLIYEGVRNYDSETLGKYFSTLPTGQGKGNLIKR